MGMFDVIHCEYELPGNPPAFAKNAEFQTKDLECLLCRYTITADGRLVQDKQSGWVERNEDSSSFTGTINFYTNNIVACGPGVYTTNGEDAVYLAYRATFVDNKLTKIEEIENRTELAAKHHYPKPLTEEEKQAQTKAIEAQKAKENENFLGKTLWCFWGGGTSVPYSVKIIAENDKELVGQKQDSKFEVLSRWQLRSTLFETFEEGVQYKKEREEKWEKELQEFEEEISKKKK